MELAATSKPIKHCTPHCLTKPGLEEEMIDYSSFNYAHGTSIHHNHTSSFYVIHSKNPISEGKPPKHHYSRRDFNFHILAIDPHIEDLRDKHRKQGLSAKNFDETYGPAWHCVVGVDFGSCITHLCGSFTFFHVEMMEFLIFKDGKDMDERKQEAIRVLQKGEENNLSRT